MKSQLKRLRAQGRLMLISRGKMPKQLDVEEIPKKWETFPESEDRWVNVDFPESENTTACLYEAKAGSIFDPHWHGNQIVEHLVILTKKATLTAYTESRTKEVEFPNGVVFDPHEIHAVKFNNDMKVLIMWHPKFDKGWRAEFLQKETVDKTHDKQAENT